MPFHTLQEGSLRHALRTGYWFLLVSVVCAGLAVPGRVAAASDPVLRIDDGVSDVHLTWQIAAGTHPRLDATLGLSTVAYGGAELPGTLLAVQVDHDGPVLPLLSHVVSTPWRGALPRRAAPLPVNAAGVPRPDLAVPHAVALPAAPLVVLRDGRVRGVRVVVLLLSPVFQGDGQLRLATDMTASIAPARLFTADSSVLFARVYHNGAKVAAELRDGVLDTVQQVRSLGERLPGVVPVRQSVGTPLQPTAIGRRFHPLV